MPIHESSSDGRLARRLFATSHMLDTKWRKVFTAIEDHDPHCRSATIKFIDVDSPKQIRFPTSLECPHDFMDPVEFGPTPLRSIEWVDFPIDIRPLLKSIGKFTTEYDGSRTRIIGYSGKY